MQTEIEPRVRKRVPCTINVDGGQHRGFVLNVSRGGLFVQTSLPANPGSLIGIDLSSPVDDALIALSGTVVWRRRISPRMMGINQSGMGVRLDAPPQAWTELIREGRTDDASQHSEASEAAAPRWTLRLAHAGTPRTRRIVVHCVDEAEARARAIAEAGADWEIIELTVG
jgi:hypothetical protein